MFHQPLFEWMIASWGSKTFVFEGLPTPPGTYDFLAEANGRKIIKKGILQPNPQRDAFFNFTATFRHWISTALDGFFFATLLTETAATTGVFNRVVRLLG